MPKTGSSSNFYFCTANIWCWLDNWLSWHISFICLGSTVDILHVFFQVFSTQYKLYTWLIYITIQHSSQWQPLFGRQNWINVNANVNKHGKENAVEMSNLASFELFGFFLHYQQHKVANLAITSFFLFSLLNLLLLLKFFVRYAAKTSY